MQSQVFQLVDQVRADSALAPSDLSRVGAAHLKSVFHHGKCTILSLRTCCLGGSTITDALISVVVLGSLQFFVAFFILWQAILSRSSVTAMKAAYLEGHLRLAIVPRGATGVLNMRLENTGHGAVEEVKLSFPLGLRVIGSNGVELVVKDGSTVWELGSMGPAEKREWNIGFAGHEDFSKLGDTIEYILGYRRAGARKKATTKGSLALKSYLGTLVRAYADQEDVLQEIVKLTISVESLASQHKELSETVKRFGSTK